MKRILAMLLSAVMIFTSLSLTPVMADEDGSGTIAEGTVSDGISWSIDGEGELKITGEGVIPDYEESELYGGTAPWCVYREDISSLYIGEGIEAIGTYAFAGIYSMGYAQLPDSLLAVGEGAFYRCGLEEISIPSFVETIGDRAFANNGNIVRAYLSPGISRIGANAADIICFAGTQEQWEAVGGYEAAADVVLDNDETIIGGASVLWPDGSAFTESGGAVYFSVPETASYDLNIQTPEACTVTVDLSYMSGSNFYTAASGSVNTTGTEETVPFSFTGDAGLIYRGYIYNTDFNNPLPVTMTLTKGDGIGTTEDGFGYEKGTNDAGETMMRITSYSGDAAEVRVPASINGFPVREIAEYAFHYNDTMEKLVIPEGVKTLGYSICGECTALKAVELPSTLQRQYSNPFVRCYGVTVSFPNGSDVYRAENNCLIDVDPDSMQGTLRSYTGPQEAEEAVVPDGVVTINYGALKGFSFGKLILPKSLAEFFGRDSVSVHELYIESADLYIDDSAVDWNELQTVYAYPGGSLEALCTQKGIRFAALEEPLSGTCGENLTWELVETEEGSGLYDLKISGTGKMEDYSVVYSDEKTISKAPWGSRAEKILSVEMPEGITGIGANAFTGASALENITLPKTLECIGDSAFDSCSSLEQIILPAGITELGNFTFSNCSGLTAAVLPEKLVQLKNGVFSRCSSLKSVTIPDSVSEIGNSCFSGCTSLTEITLPSSLTSLSAWLFSGCSSLKKVTLPSSLKDINKAFMYCTSLESIEIPGSVETIRANAFYECSALKEVILNEGLAGIEYYAFEYCPALTDITIPGSVTSIADEAFYGTTEMTIRGYAGSAAEAFAAKKGFTFVALEEAVPPVITLSATTKGIGVSWTEVSGTAEYSLQRQTGNGSWIDLKTVTDTEYTDADVQMNTTYSYRARALVNGSWGDYSEAVSMLFNPFTDVSGNKTIRNIAWAFNNGIVNGTSETTFSPNDNCTRIQFVMMLWKMNGSKVVGGKNPFSDISGKKTTNAILWALDEGIINSGNTFNPDDPISRVQVVMILWKMAGSPKASGNIPFKDVSGKKTINAVSWAYDNGITSGTSDTTFSPDNNCTRVQLVFFLKSYNDTYKLI